MMKLCLKYLSVFASTGVLLIFLNSGCGGGGGSGGGGGGPTAPTIADVAGSWAGELTLESATGCGCVGSLFQLFVGISEDYTMEISQDGAAIQSTWTSVETGEWCRFTGTVGSESFRAEGTGCLTEEELDVECLNGNRRDLEWTGSTWQGTVLANEITGTFDETWDCFDSATNDAKGTLTLAGSFSQTRG